jgi:hypothetical protein
MGQNANTFGYALNAVAAAGADFAVSNGVITLTGVGSFPYDKVTTNIVKQIAVTADPRVTIVTFSAPSAVGQVYQVVIDQPLGTSSNRFPVTITVSATDTNADTIGQAFKTAFEAQVTAGLLAGTASGGAAAITITGTATFPMLRVVSTSAAIALNVTTAGNPAVNLGSQLLAEGVTDAEPTAEYTTFTFQNLTSTGLVTNDGVFRGLIYAIDEADGDAATLIDQMTAVLGGGVSAASPDLANPELIGKLA